MRKLTPIEEERKYYILQYRRINQQIINKEKQLKELKEKEKEIVKHLITKCNLTHEELQKILFPKHKEIE